MPDWSASMQRTYEYYKVNPITWADDEMLKNVKSCSINWDRDTDTLGSATIDITESVGECYIRAYLITIQNGVREKHPLGTFLVQTPSSSFDGKVRTVTMDAYTPLIELKEKSPPLGYSLFKGANIMESAYQLTFENVRAPVVENKCETGLYSDFVADVNDNWFTFIRDLMSNAKYSYDLDPMGKVLFSPAQDTASLQPIWTYTDDNSSILYPELTMNHDLYGIPNVVEVIYSRGREHFYYKAVNDDPNSPISTVNRGREIMYRVTDPNMIGDPTKDQIEEYAKQTLREMSTLEYTISYSHGYCPVRVGDCVRLNYSRAGLMDVKAKVISQTIRCTEDCPVNEKAIFTTKLWG